MMTHTLEACLEGIHRHATHALRGIIGVGCYLLKANEVHCLPPSEKGQGRKSNATVALDFPTAREGFDQWVAENLSDIGVSRRSAYNYMNAARNCGLTAASTDEDIAALDLTGKKAKELYSSDTQKPNPPTLPPVTANEKAEQLWLPLWVDMDRYAQPEGLEAKALWDLPMVSADPNQPSIAALEIKLKAALDLISEVKTKRQKSRR